jgi:hypothetical protein
MMLTIRRSLVILALMFWQGGFTFYASVVVPVAQEEIGHRKQGFITRRVTNFLNLSTALGLGVLAWEELASRDPSRPRRRLRVVLWLGLLATLLGLLWLHGRLEDHLDPDSRLIFERTTFHDWHRLYLWVSTVQWGCALAYVVLLMAAWRKEDDRFFKEENGQTLGLLEEETKKVPPLTPSASPSHRSHHAAEQ